VAPTEDGLPTPVPLPIDFKSAALPALPARPSMPALPTQLPSLPPQPVTGPDAALSPRSWEAKELSRREKKEAKKLRKKEEEDRKREKKKEKREKKVAKKGSKVTAMATLSMPHTPSAPPATAPVQHHHQQAPISHAPTPPKSTGHSDTMAAVPVGSLASASTTLETPKEKANFFEMSKSKDIQLNDDEALKAGSKKRHTIFKKSSKTKTKTPDERAISRTQSGLKLESKPYLSIWYARPVDAPHLNLNGLARLTQRLCSSLSLSLTHTHTHTHHRLPGADTLSPPRIHKLKKKKLFVGSDSSCHICVPDEGCAKRQALIYSGMTTLFVLAQPPLPRQCAASG
jgi:hypothetical protein